MTFRSIHVSMEVSAREVIMFDETQNSHVPCEVWMDVAVPFGAQQKCSKLLGGGGCLWEARVWRSFSAFLSFQLFSLECDGRELTLPMSSALELGPC